MKKQFRVKSSREFSAIMANRHFYSSPTIVLYMKKKSEEKARVGITVSKKLGNAVKRNKIKRQIRMMVQEIFDFKENYDVIILVREKYNEENFNTNRKNLSNIYKKSKIRM